MTELASSSRHQLRTDASVILQLMTFRQQHKFHPLVPCMLVSECKTRNCKTAEFTKRDLANCFRSSITTRKATTATIGKKTPTAYQFTFVDNCPVHFPCWILRLSVCLFHPQISHNTLQQLNVHHSTLPPRCKVITLPAAVL